MPSATASCDQRPCTESNMSRCAAHSAPPLGSLMTTQSNSGQFQAARKVSRPMRPKPLMPMRVFFMLRSDWLGKFFLFADFPG